MARYARPDSADGTFSLFAGKAYAIFALLFGLTFFLQNDRQKREGKDFGWRFLWRIRSACSSESPYSCCRCC